MLVVKTGRIRQDGSDTWPELWQELFAWALAINLALGTVRMSLWTNLLWLNLKLRNRSMTFYSTKKRWQSFYICTHLAWRCSMTSTVSSIESPASIKSLTVRRKTLSARKMKRMTSYSCESIVAGTWTSAWTRCGPAGFSQRPRCTRLEIMSKLRSSTLITGIEALKESRDTLQSMAW